MNIFVPPYTLPVKTKNKRNSKPNKHKKHPTREKRSISSQSAMVWTMASKCVFYTQSYAPSRDSGQYSVLGLPPVASCPNVIPRALHGLGDCTVNRTELSWQVDEGRTDFPFCFLICVYEYSGCENATLTTLLKETVCLFSALHPSLTVHQTLPWRDHL